MDSLIHNMIIIVQTYMYLKEVYMKRAYKYFAHSFVLWNWGKENDCLGLQ